VVLALTMCAVAGWTRLAALTPLYLVAELVLASAMVGLVRSRHARLARATVIDASILTLGFAAITWLYLVGPYATAASSSGLTRLMAPVVSAADLLLIGAGALLMIGALRQGRPRA
jgi:hypothetical protein